VRRAPDRPTRGYRAVARRRLHRNDAKRFREAVGEAAPRCDPYLFDWLVTGQVVATNPAHAVRGPKHVVKTGKTTVLDVEQARRLLDSIDVSTIVGLRDRALISVMTFAFARIGAVVAMRVEDYYPKGKRWWVRLHEKGGKRHEMPAHHNLEEYLDTYIKAAGIGDGDKAPLFRSAVGRTGTLTEKPMNRIDAWRMIQTPGGRTCNKGSDRLSYISGHRDHRLSRSRRHAGKCPGHGRA
jgi:site-specific recombinase XerC